jgi:hypothetical protein
MSVWTKVGCLVGVSALIAGCGMMSKVPGGGTGATGSGATGGTGTGLPTACNDDRGVEQAGKEMNDKAFDAVVASQNSLAYVYDAAGKKPEADKARATAKKWQENKDKAPSGGERINVVKTATENIQKEVDTMNAAPKTDAGTQTALKSARMELRKALVYVAWGTKIGAPVPDNAKAAIEANKACAGKTKGAVDAAAGLSTLMGKMKSTYASVDGAVKKSGGGEMTEQEKKTQEAETGAPTGLGI